MNTCILISTCERYRALTEFTRARLREFWKDAPPLRHERHPALGDSVGRPEQFGRDPRHRDQYLGRPGPGEQPRLELDQRRATERQRGGQRIRPVGRIGSRKDEPRQHRARLRATQRQAKGLAAHQRANLSPTAAPPRAGSA